MNFELAATDYQKLSFQAVKRGISIKDFLTALSFHSPMSEALRTSSSASGDGPGVIQKEAQQVIERLETLFQGPLNDELAYRAASAPLRQLEAIQEDWIDLERLEAPDHLAPLARGELRPIFGPYNSLPGGGYWDEQEQIELAPKLLMYVDSVIEDARWLMPFSWHSTELEEARAVQRYDVWDMDRSVAAQRELTLNKLRRLVEMKPFIESGSILFTDKTGVYGDGVHQYMPDKPIVHADSEDLDYLLRANVQIALAGRGNTVSLNGEEELAYARSITRSAVDARLGFLDKLVNLNVPILDGGAAALAELHQSGSFREWRASLENALRLVNHVGSSPADQAEVRGLLHNELSRALQHLVDPMDREMSRLRVKKRTMYDLKVSLVGATAQAVVGASAGALAGTASGVDPLTAVLLAGAGGLAGAVTKDVFKATALSKEGSEQRKAEKTARAVSTLLLSFNETSH